MIWEDNDFDIVNGKEIMKMRKKILVTAMVAVMAVWLAGCGKGQEEAAEKPVGHLKRQRWDFRMRKSRSRKYCRRKPQGKSRQESGGA